MQSVSAKINGQWIDLMRSVTNQWQYHRVSYSQGHTISECRLLGSLYSLLPALLTSATHDHHLITFTLSSSVKCLVALSSY